MSAPKKIIHFDHKNLKRFFDEKLLEKEPNYEIWKKRLLSKSLRCRYLKDRWMIIDEKSCLGIVNVRIKLLKIFFPFLLVKFLESAYWTTSKKIMAF